MRRSEIICNDAFLVSGMELDDLKERLGIAILFPGTPLFRRRSVQKMPDEAFWRQFAVSGLGVEEFPNGVDCGRIASFPFI